MALYQDSARARSVKPWRKKEKEFLFENIDKLTLTEICNKLGRNERSVKLFLHRNRFEPRLLKDTLLLRILKLKFGDPTLFTPNREFYKAIKIGQKRFFGILKGDSVIKDEECIRIADFFEIPYETVMQVRQLDLFE